MASASLPEHKVIPRTSFIVDGFKYQHPSITAYFLSHAHGDHYTGLRETWDYGPIYCSPVTGKLVVKMTGVSADLIRTLEWETPTVIEGVEVTIVDANHCPGAAQLLFKLQSGETYVHCGDMRFRPHLMENPYLMAFRGCNAVFLDTTYCNPKYTFPPQEEVVEYVASTIYDLMASGDGKRRLFLIQTYLIGKEKILMEVSRRCQKKLFLSDRKMGFMECLDMPGLIPAEVFTTNPEETNIHLTQWGWLGESWPFFRPNFKNMEEARRDMSVDEVVGFCPTGWMYEMKKKLYPIKSKGACHIHLVPYSEHSSYSELRDYVRFLRPHKVIPTVGVDGGNADKNKVSILKHFRNLVNETASKATFLAAFQRSEAIAEASEDEGKEQGQSEGEAEGESSDKSMECAVDIEAEGSAELQRGVNVVKEEKAEPQEAGVAMPVQESAGSEPSVVVKEERIASVEAATSRRQEGVSQLLAVLGDGISEEAARKLLVQCGGDLQKAVNAFYNTSEAGRASLGSRVKPAAKTQPSPQAKGAKRKRAASKAFLPSAKQSTLSPEQRQITSFFGQGRPASAAKSPAGNPAKNPADDTCKGMGSGPPLGRAESLKPEPIDVDVSSDVSQEVRDREDREAGKGGDEPTTIPPKPQLRLPPAPLISPRLQSKRQKTSTRDPAPAATPSNSPSNAPDASTPGKAQAIPGNSKDIEGKQASSMPPSPTGPSWGMGPKKDTGGSKPLQPDRVSMVPWDAMLKDVKLYDPVEMAIWGQGVPAPYLHVSRALKSMDGTTKRLIISDVIANMFRSLLALSPEDLLPAAYLVTGKLGPDYEGVEMSVGSKAIGGAIQEATGVTRQRLSSMYKDLGDLGDVAQACRHNQATLQKPAPLTVRGVFKAMQQIAAAKGNGSGNTKQRIVLGLLRSAREEEPKYLVRTLISNLRVGANWRTVIPGLARAFLLHERGGEGAPTKAELDAAAARVSEAFHLCPNLDILIPALRQGGLEELERRCTLTAGIPLKPMLAKICEGIPDALRQLQGDFLAEFKYDGQRSQIHLLPDNSVKLFSRNCDDKTAAFPDVVEMLQQAAQGGGEQMVLDAELVAVDRSDGNRLRSFQEMSTRARGQTEIHQVSVQVCVFVFDILMLDGEPLIKRSLRERRARIAEALPHMRPGYIQLAQSIELSPEPDVPKPEPDGEAGAAEEEGTGGVEARVQSYLLEAFASGTEGLMLKALDTKASYQASKRSESWLKLKRDYCEGLRDSLDLVPIGAWWGNGRKTGWFSPFLLAAWDPEREEYQSVCRCMSGFTDLFYTEATKRLEARKCDRKAYYNTAESCSVWFEPGEVWEIRGADLTLSPVHKAAIGRIEANPERGVSLRFPRYICTREDKGVEDATTPDVIVELYDKQTRKMSSAKEMLQKKKGEGAEAGGLLGEMAEDEASLSEADEGEEDLE